MELIGALCAVIGSASSSKTSKGSVTPGAESVWAAVAVKGCDGPKFVPELHDDDQDLEMFVAIYYRYMHLLSDLLTSNSNLDVNQQDSMGRTPADFAAIMGETKMMELLMQNGGKCHVKNTTTMRILALRRGKAKTKE